MLAVGCSKTSPVTVDPIPTAAPIASPASTSNQTSGWQSTVDSKYGYSIKYPSEFTFTDNVNDLNSDQVNFLICTYSSMVGCVFCTGNAYDKTNLDGAGVLVNIDKTLSTEAKCYSFNDQTSEAQTPVADVTINGVDFKSATGGGAAAGHSDKLQTYRNFYNGMCYEISQDVASSNISNYPSGTIQPFDETVVWQKLQGVVNSFAFVGSPASQNISENEAIDLVTSLPEVQTYIQRLKAALGKPVVAGDDQLNQTDPANPYWNVHVYEDLPDHVATFGWYEVDQKDGKITKEQ